MTLDQLKEKALKVEDGMRVYWPQFGKEESPINLAEFHLSENKERFSYNNSVIAFVDENESLYVIPALKGIEKLLRESGYQKAYFYIPFSNWDYPIDYQEEWEALWKEKNAK